MLWIQYNNHLNISSSVAFFYINNLLNTLRRKCEWQSSKVKISQTQSCTRRSGRPTTYSFNLPWYSPLTTTNPNEKSRKHKLFGAKFRGVGNFFCEKFTKQKFCKIVIYSIIISNGSSSSSSSGSSNSVIGSDSCGGVNFIIVVLSIAVVNEIWRLTQSDCMGNYSKWLLNLW